MIYVDYPERERRRAYRISPGPHTPIQLAINGVAVPILDISVNGVAFKADPSDPPFDLIDDQRPALLFIGGEHHPIPVSLELVSEVQGEYRCRLHHHDLLSQKRLSQFIVQHQKQAIRMMRQAEQLRSGEESQADEIFPPEG